MTEHNWLITENSCTCGYQHDSLSVDHWETQWRNHLNEVRQEEMEYSSFSSESLQKSISDMITEIKEKTSATDEQISTALQEVVEKFMNLNTFRN